MDTRNMNYDLERKPDPSKRFSLYQKAFGGHMEKKDTKKETAENGTNGRRK